MEESAIPPIGLVPILCVLAFLVQASAAECPAPHYRQGMVWEESESSVFVAVSIPLKDFAPGRLVCLAQAFRQRYRNQKKIQILIFSSRNAARQTDPYPVAEDASLRDGRYQKQSILSFWLGHLHGYYFYDAEKREEHIDIRPFGSDFEGGPDDTRINLPARGTPRCHWEITGRCMLALEPIVYPDEALTHRISGTVMLTGFIARSGKITRIEVADLRVQPQAKKETLVNEAVRNLKTWRFAPASRKDTIRITYSYRIDPALPIPPLYRKFGKSQLELPSQVTILGRSLE